MSDVKMCDRDGLIFSTNVEGWSSTQGTVNRRYADGSHYVEQVKVDFCPACTASQLKPKVPMPELESLPLPDQGQEVTQ